MGVSRKPRDTAGKLVWLPCKTTPPRHTPADGTTLAVASVRPSFLANVYCGDADNATASWGYRCNNADGSGRNIAGAYIVKPDARGRFVRGYDATSPRKLNDNQNANVGYFDWRVMADDGDDTFGDARSVKAIEVQFAGVATADVPAGQWSAMQRAFVTPDDTRPNNLAMVPYLVL